MTSGSAFRSGMRVRLQPAFPAVMRMRQNGTRHKDNTICGPMKDSVSIIWLDTVDSTNNEAARRMDGLANLSVIASRSQTAGRGQRGNSWTAAPGENLTFSMILKFPDDFIAARGQFVISEAAALAVSQLLEEEGQRPKIKWPNDIYVGDRKICGMLIENTLRGRYIATSTVGIGLNLNQRDFPAGIVNPVSLKMLTGRSYDIGEVLARLSRILARRFGDMAGNREITEREYLSRMYRMGEVHEYTDCLTGQVFKGRIKGISPEAKLVVEMPDGLNKEFSFKEISYII